jgi:adenosylcobinamide-GDP ribazoletransferase
MWAPPLLAVQFLTRVPVPGLASLSEDAVRVGLGRAVAWFPLVGAMVGTVTAGTVLLAEQVWPRWVAVIVALIVEARLTGAFHEDAVADFCDGVGGGRDAAHVRQIMKDSRIGTYGALGLMLAVGLRAALMFSLDATHTAIAIIAAATLGRLMAVIAMGVTPPVPLTTAAQINVASSLTPSPAGGLGRDITAGVQSRDIALAFVTATPGLLPFALVSPTALLFASIAALGFLVWFKALVLRRVGGVTGDCLGFAAYTGQLLLLLAAVANFAARA